jgi:AraC family transcriptional regulator
VHKEVLVNPAPRLIGHQNAVLSGRGRQYDVRGFASPLSIKSVIRGSATWTTAAGRFVLEPGSALIVNGGEEYDLTIDALQPVETFCIFFSRGFVEDAYRATTSPSAALLDAPPPERQIEPGERLVYASPLLAGMQETHARMQRGEALGENIVALASSLVSCACDVEARVSRLPALRATTREELRRRIACATDYIHSNIDAPLPLADVASAACLSTFHFHRLFAAFHGETPHRYITRVRLERARALLAHSSRGDRSVADVALACGFESVGSFTTLFARLYGCPPGRFRKNEEESRREPA